MKEVFIIDDDPDLRALVRRLLEKEYAVIEAETAERGLQLIQRDRREIVLLDIGLPGRDGISALRSLKSNKTTKEIVVIMLTADGSAQTVTSAARMGANDFVVKPFKPDYLKAKVLHASRVIDLAREQIMVTGGGSVDTERTASGVIFRFEGVFSLNSITRVKELLTPALLSLISSNDPVLDLRYLPSIQDKQIPMLQELIKLFDATKLRILAGKNYMVAFSLDLNTDEQIFLSEEDLERFKELQKSQAG